MATAASDTEENIFGFTFEPILGRPQFYGKREFYINKNVTVDLTSKNLHLVGLTMNWRSLWLDGAEEVGLLNCIKPQSTSARNEEPSSRSALKERPHFG